jgi:nitrate/TMAO reductase-like tetraheme cytochrome c subunit
MATKQRQAQYSAEWRLKNPTYHRTYYDNNKETIFKNSRKSRLKKYNLTPEEFDQLIKNQDYKCAICKNDFEKGTLKKTHIDHCHETGKVRGILCVDCNVGIGHLKHSVHLLKAAIAYL